MTVSAAASPCCGDGGPGAIVAAFFVTARFAFALVTRFLGVVLAATRLAVFVRAARAFLPLSHGCPSPMIDGPWCHLKPVWLDDATGRAAESPDKRCYRRED